MSDTPRTDAVEAGLAKERSVAFITMRSHAKQLEQELNEARRAVNFDLEEAVFDAAKALWEASRFDLSERLQRAYSAINKK